MLPASLDCLLNPEVDCFFETEPVTCDEPVVDIGQLFESPDFSSFLTLLDTSMVDGRIQDSELSTELVVAAEPQPASSLGNSECHRSFTSAGSVTLLNNSPTSSTNEFVSSAHDVQTATSLVKIEQPCCSTGPVDQLLHVSRPAKSCSTSVLETSSKSDSQSCQDASRSNKRKLPEIDWRAIDDPEERRRQRRLAKNRVTAARSRERKKVQWGEMQQKLDEAEDENTRLKEMLQNFIKENSTLKEQLASLTRSASAAVSSGGEEPAPLLPPSASC